MTSKKTILIICSVAIVLAAAVADAAYKGRLIGVIVDPDGVIVLFDNGCHSRRAYRQSAMATPELARMTKSFGTPW